MERLFLSGLPSERANDVTQKGAGDAGVKGGMGVGSGGEGGWWR